MILSFKTSITYNFFLTLYRTTVSVVKQLSSDVTQFFAGHCPMSGAYIQACAVCGKILVVIDSFKLHLWCWSWEVFQIFESLEICHKSRKIWVHLRIWWCHDNKNLNSSLSNEQYALKMEPNMHIVST